MATEVQKFCTGFDGLHEFEFKKQLMGKHMMTFIKCNKCNSMYTGQFVDKHYHVYDIDKCVAPVLDKYGTISYVCGHVRSK